jgi:hypothetical protein
MIRSCIELVESLSDEDYRIEDGRECTLRFWIRSIKGYDMFHQQGALTYANNEQQTGDFKEYAPTSCYIRVFHGIDLDNTEPSTLANSKTENSNSPFPQPWSHTKAISNISQTYATKPPHE